MVKPAVYEAVELHPCGLAADPNHLATIGRQVFLEVTECSMQSRIDDDTTLPIRREAGVAWIQIDCQALASQACQVQRPVLTGLQQYWRDRRASQTGRHSLRVTVDFCAQVHICGALLFGGVIRRANVEINSISVDARSRRPTRRAIARPAPDGAPPAVPAPATHRVSLGSRTAVSCALIRTHARHDAASSRAAAKDLNRHSAISEEWSYSGLYRSRAVTLLAHSTEPVAAHQLGGEYER